MRIVITGASGGIGQELSRHLASQGHQLVGLARDRNKLQQLQTALGTHSFSFFTTDVADREGLQAVFAEIIAAGPIDALINAAALLRPVATFGDCDLAEWEQTVRVNFFGSVYTSYYALPSLLGRKQRDGGRGKIINFAGGGSAYGRPAHSAYGSSKAGMIRFTETLGMEYPGLDVNIIAPGAHKTPMWGDEKTDPEPESWGDMQHLLDFVDFLLSGRSDNLSGKFLHYKDAWEEILAQKLPPECYTLRRVEP